MTSGVPGAPAADGRRGRAAALVLSFAAGATDAFAFLLLGGVFTANMTGNLVLAGLVERPGYPAALLGIVVAIAAFVAGLFAAFAIARAGTGTRRLLAVLALGTTAQALVLIGWLLLPDRTTMAGQAPLLALSAFAMAGQTAVSKRTARHSGVTTTYVTGTLTSLVEDWSDRKPQEAGLRVGVVLALVAGALSGSLLIALSPTAGAALPLLPAIVGMALFARRASASPPAAA